MLIAVGAVLLIAGYLVWGVFLMPMLAGLVLIIAGLELAAAVHRHYTVRLNQNDGQVLCFSLPTRLKRRNSCTQSSGPAANAPVSGPRRY